MITFTPLSESDHSHFAQKLFEEAFPEQERPPFSSLRQRDAGQFHFLVAENGDEPVGILTYWTFEDLVYIEHFAIAEDLRNQGLGKATFLYFLSQQTEQVVLEVETPHSEESEHRVEFYASLTPTYIFSQRLATSTLGEDHRRSREHEKVEVLRPFNVRASIGLGTTLRGVGRLEFHIDLLPTFRSSAGAPQTRMMGLSYTF